MAIREDSDLPAYYGIATFIVSKENLIKRSEYYRETLKRDTSYPIRDANLGYAAPPEGTGERSAPDAR